MVVVVCKYVIKGICCNVIFQVLNKVPAGFSRGNLDIHLGFHAYRREPIFKLKYLKSGDLSTSFSSYENMVF